MSDEKNKKREFLSSLAETFSSKFPNLRKKLKLADSPDTPVSFLKKALSSTFFLSLALIVITALFILTNELGLILLIPAIILFPLIIFGYFMLYPDAAIVKRTKELDYEVVFAGRHIVIALQSGMPLFDTFVGTSKGYGAISREFSKIVDKVVVGAPTTQAIREIVQDNPSNYFVRMMMQIANSLASGADVGESMESVMEQISKEQMIQLREYSQKLTPVVMFYMVFGIIVPSLGIVLATVIFSVFSGLGSGGLGLTSFMLVPAFFFIAIVQFLFLGIIESSRPKYLI